MRWDEVIRKRWDEVVGGRSGGGRGGKVRLEPSKRRAHLE